jgi:hypothetical protein
MTDDVFPIDIFGKFAEIAQSKKTSVKLQKLKAAMVEKLADIEEFDKRLVIITDTIDNISRVLNDEKLVSYDEFAQIRQAETKMLLSNFAKKHQTKKRHKCLKKIKKVKRCLKKAR